MLKQGNIFLQNSFVVGEETSKIINLEKINKPPDVNDAILKHEMSAGWWIPSSNGKKRIMLCGTYPIGTSNGYSKVVYYISKYLGLYGDIEFTVYGFQNFNNTIGASIRNDIPKNVKIHDVYPTENPRRNGFGELEIGSFLKKNPQDIIIIFNDNIITSSLAQTIMVECGGDKKNFKLVSYMDQVYNYQKSDYINLLNKYFDAIIAFTPYWENIAKKLGVRNDMPMFSFPHGFDTGIYFPIPMNVCRTYFNIDQEAFTIVNLNRNQPRKRWDITIIAWIEFVERHYMTNVKNIKGDIKCNKHTKRPIKLIIGTSIDGYWNLNDLIETEVKFRDVPLEYVKNTIYELPNPQGLSDKDINILYNATNVGINTAEGEGFGLTSIEGAALGKPQIVTNCGGHIEFLDNSFSTLINPVAKLYGDLKSNGIASVPEICSYKDFADAMWKYFSNPDLEIKHGIRARKHILTHYRWETMVEYFYGKIIPNL